MFRDEVLTCSHCQGEMHPVRLRVGRLRVLSGGLLMACGVLLLLQSPPQPILAMPAVLMLALSWWVGLRREGIWYCTSCSHTSPRSGLPIDIEQRRQAEPAA